MRAVVKGQIVAVEVRQPYTDRQGNLRETFKAWIAGGDPRYAADTYDGPIELIPAKGDFVEQLVTIKPQEFVDRQTGERRVFLSVFAVRDEQLVVAAAPVTEGRSFNGDEDA